MNPIEALLCKNCETFLVLLKDLLVQTDDIYRFLYFFPECRVSNIYSTSITVLKCKMCHQSLGGLFNAQNRFPHAEGDRIVRFSSQCVTKVTVCLKISLINTFFFRISKRRKYENVVY